MDNYIVLDLETQKLSDEVEGGWNNIKDFGVAVAICWHEGHYKLKEGFFSIHADWNDATQRPAIDALSDKGIYVWDIDLLISYLESAPLIVSFNGIKFDYEVLRPYGLKPELLYPKSFDILDRMKKVLGHRVSLESVAQATLGVGKTGSGTEAVRFWKEGKLDAVIDYCKMDVDITKRIYEFIQKHGFCYYLNLNRESCRTPCLTDDR